jgi:hypothetical protein
MYIKVISLEGSLKRIVNQREGVIDLGRLLEEVSFEPPTRRQQNLGLCIRVILV